MNWATEYHTQLQPLDFFDGLDIKVFFSSFALCLSFISLDTPLTQKSTVITQASHSVARTNSVLSEINDFCLAVQHISNALMELHTSLISTERKKIKVKLECFGDFGEVLLCLCRLTVLRQNNMSFWFLNAQH